MANRITKALNDTLDSMPDIGAFYAKTSLRAAYSAGRFSPADCAVIDCIDTYCRLSGFEVYEAQRENRDRIRRLADQLTGTLCAARTSFSVSFCVDGDTRVYLGAPRRAAQAVRRTVTGDLFQAALADEWLSPFQLRRLQRSNRIIVGGRRLRDGDMDRVLNALDGVQCLISFLCAPCPPQAAAAEISALDGRMDRLQRMSRTELAVGSNRARRLENDNHDVLDAIDCLDREKQMLRQAALTGLWQTVCYVSAPDRAALDKACAALTAALSAAADPAADNVTPVSLEMRFAPIDGTRWYFPNAFVGGQDLGGLNGNTLATLTDSTSLATLIRFPLLPHRGFSVRHAGPSGDAAGAFDRFSPRVSGADAFRLGRTGGGDGYLFSLDWARRHVFVTGTTQYGKSTTVRQLLRQAYGHGVPFVVVEAAKKDYWRLARSPGMRGVEVYSFGMDAKPLLLNPFIPEQNTRLEAHIQSLINALLSMFTAEDPLPQILTNLVYRCYEQRGWDPRRRVQADTDLAYPTLEDLLQNLDAVVDEIGYADDVRRNMTGVVRVRVTSLIRQAGEYMCAAENISMARLFRTSAVIELEDLSPDIKAFAAAMIAIRADEYSKQQPMGGPLRRLLVLEEAHHLLPNTEKQSISKNRAKCSEYFSNMLAEVSAYGTGIVVVDQRATAVSSAAIANTGVKLVHSVREGADRACVAAAMSLSETEARLLDTLAVGQAVIAVPQAAEVCRVTVDPEPEPDGSWHCGCLFCTDRHCRDFSGAVTAFDRRYLRANGVSAASLRRCVQDAAARLGPLTLSEKMCYAGHLCAQAGLPAQRTRQALFDLYEMMAR